MSGDKTDKFSVVNVVGGGNIGRELELDQLSKDFPEGSVQYDPDSFAAVVVRYDDPKATIMIYSSGKYSLAGASSIKEAECINDEFVRTLSKLLDRTPNLSDFEIRYIVVTADLGTNLDLNSAFLLLDPNSTEYEPEQFPALFFRPDGKDWFCSIFSSGKIVINGCKDLQDAEVAYQFVKRELSAIL